MENNLAFVGACPHCGGGIEIERDQVNCGVFRHGVVRGGGQIPPHAGKKECEALANQGVLLGCGKPFRATGVFPLLGIELCEYET